MNIKDGDYNVRIVVEKGVPKVDKVLKLYKEGKNTYMWKEVPESVKEKISRAELCGPFEGV